MLIKWLHTKGIGSPLVQCWTMSVTLMYACRMKSIMKHGNHKILHARLYWRVASLENAMASSNNLNCSCLTIAFYFSCPNLLNRVFQIAVSLFFTNFYFVVSWYWPTSYYVVLRMWDKLHHMHMVLQYQCNGPNIGIDFNFYRSLGNFRR